ncbi:hypothetical protein A2W67_01775 [Candidatus Nomurabacteria bacterium RIFCSPLOWO2_02_40_28]|uniref:S-layer-like protein array protein n=2 Tax=Candidatus Nomuraibacteriota TaxID=1752729 RepID=A0A837HVI3_9BACT|nr:MAG: hypothetical protein UT27_C0005G0005 [Candidatus Nomurabacteria bacterium GW2011_GWD2_39_12]KKR20271.1 MAG: hypothetical protein UT51_C0005G0004 [Candidatus Nomurabacteria bacterium GW2011_GWC2_39_41]KKR36517.1 MAG: hypothetical protein UT70_C0010G0004 [Candidatus Nomurabacteria bacterium GW2011_GWE2_40_10]KKR38364.1 MAG: hypothetical protein UT73_C0003G0004 [Candidatus Nomurabacteria bacterium GW2011_GWB1_40_11]KKR39863.1 MAG: hypothetical protein UT74_C0005G0080 [Parcubacteria group b
MAKKVALFFITLVFFSSCQVAFASLTITEIMYDLSGSDSTSSKSREWIEVYNSGSVLQVDASKWRVYDGAGNRTINGEVDFTIPAGGYIIFAGDKDTFLSDHPNFSGTVYDTGITSLNNTGANLKILDQDGEVIDLVTYASGQGGAGDGNSLQKISSSWQGSTPTPGVANETAMNSSNTESSNSTSDNSFSTTQTKSKVVEEPKIKTKITAKDFVFTGVPVEFQASTTRHSGEALFYGRYFWNFGDGDSREIKINDMINGKFTHTYLYEGDYNVTLEYYLNNYGDVPDAYDGVTIEVVPAEISISRLGDQQDFFVELSNNADYDTDISNWILKSDIKSFTIPRKTIINSKNKLIISSKVTQFSVLDRNLKLTTPQGNIIFNFLPDIIPVKQSISKPSIDKVENKISENQSSSEMPIENLEIAALANDAAGENPMRAYILTTVMTVFLGISAGGVYFIRRKKAVSSAGDDFQILDE